MTPSVSIVVPVWNQADLLRRLLGSVSKQTEAVREVIVVDNGSTDGAPEVARHWGARVISVGANRGFAAAVNRGIAESAGDWVALINSDVELETRWLENLLDAAVETAGWFACGKLLMSGSRDLLDGSWDLIATSGCPMRAGHGEPDSAAFGSRRSIALAPATATLYRRELFTQVGLFDEQYESYLEDVDFSLRCAARGLGGIYEPASVAFHQGGGSSGAWSPRVVRLLARNQILLVRKLFPAALQRKFRRRILIGRLLWVALALRHGRLISSINGVRAGLRARVDPAPLDAHALEQLLVSSELEILREKGRGLYWRLYFLFTQGESG